MTTMTIFPASARTAPLIKVVVADDHPLYREGIVRALQAHGGFTIVGEASDGQTALRLIREHHPDVALLDIRMPQMEGIEVTESLAAHGPDVPVVLLSAFTGTPLKMTAFAAGAAAFITKTSDRQAICDTVAEVVQSRRHQSPRHLSAHPTAHQHAGPRGLRA